MKQWIKVHLLLSCQNDHCLLQRGDALIVLAHLEPRPPLYKQALPHPRCEYSIGSSLLREMSEHAMQQIDKSTHRSSETPFALKCCITLPPFCASKASQRRTACFFAQGGGQSVRNTRGDCDDTTLSIKPYAHFGLRCYSAESS
jgi:hypothetical protein